MIAVLLNGPASATELSISSTSPIPQLEIGKRKNIPLADLPPTVRALANDERQSMVNGMLISDEEYLQRSNYHARLQDERNLQGRIKLRLATLDGSELSRFRYHGLLPDGPTRDGPWTSVIRVFSRADGLLIMLDEWDYVASGGGVVTVKEMMNAKVGPWPARFIVKKTADGRAISELTWASDEKYLTLSVWEDLSKPNRRNGDDLAWLIGIADQLDSVQSQASTK
ncbi:hypothetical protein [Undibacterium sp. CCC3.4]|uniref:hypothetical protein n=1 Tax=Undibacterium sp. CCC3.4 TaxID=3048609 RepID=UPI002B2378CE|nr:hypothetical protein [Undibacterium sp. CCC3.4]